MFGLIGGVLGAGLGALAGMNKKKASFTNPNLSTSYKGPLGTATGTGFKYTPGAKRQAGVNTANANLSGLLQNVFNGISPQRMLGFRSAYMKARSPELERNLALQKQGLSSSIAGQGLGGSSAALLARQMQNEGANRARMQLQNEAIVGSENLADRALQQSLAQYGAAQGLSQQNIMNQLNAMGATRAGLAQMNQTELAKNKIMNQLAAARAEQANSSSWLQNMIGGGIAGAEFGKAIGDKGGFSGLFGGSKEKIPVSGLPWLK